MPNLGSNDRFGNIELNGVSSDDMININFMLQAMENKILSFFMLKIIGKQYHL
jgi:hypothetical protein